MHGRLTNFGIAKETTKAVAMSSALKWFPWQTNTMQFVNEYAEDNSAFGSRAMLSDQILGYQSITGEFAGILNTDTIGDWLFYNFGSVSSVQTGTTGAYTHTYSMLNTTTTLPTFTSFYQYESGIASTYFKANGCRIGDLTISAKAGAEFATYSASMMGLVQSAGGAQTPAYTRPLSNMAGRHITLRTATTFAGLSSSTAISDVTEVEITFKNGTELNQVLGSLEPTNIYDLNREVEFSFTMKMLTAQANTLRDDSKNGVAQAFQIVYENTQAPVIGTSTLRPKLTINLSPALYNVDETREPDGVSLLKFTSKGQFDFTAGLIVQAVVQNATATY